MLDELREEHVSSSRGRSTPRGVKRKMSNYPLRPRCAPRQRRRSYRVHIVQRRCFIPAWNRKRATN